MLIDTHCHLDDPRLFPHLGRFLADGRRAGIRGYVIPGVSPEGWDLIASIAAAHEGVFPTFGLHPMFAHLYSDSVMERLAALASQAVAIGETGLDYTLEQPSQEEQQKAFRSQLRLAVRAGLPVIIHCRRAFRDLLRILAEEDVGRVGGVMHAFSGSPETARECIRLGLYISVAGPVTYRNAVKPLEVVRQLPLEHLLLETDAPDMTPEPHRWRNNEPAFIVEVARKVAEIKGVSVAEAAAVTSRNAERLFRLNNQ